jgi:hypothetical protein
MRPVGSGSVGTLFLAEKKLVHTQRSKCRESTLRNCGDVTKKAE